MHLYAAAYIGKQISDVIESENAIALAAGDIVLISFYSLKPV